jgi:hypothetical protein
MWSAKFLLLVHHINDSLILFFPSVCGFKAMIGADTEKDVIEYLPVIAYGSS